MSIKDLKGAVKYLEDMKGLPEIDPQQIELVKRISVPLYKTPVIKFPGPSLVSQPLPVVCLFLEFVQKPGVASLGTTTCPLPGYHLSRIQRSRKTTKSFMKNWDPGPKS